MDAGIRRLSDQLWYQSWNAVTTWNSGRELCLALLTGRPPFWLSDGAFSKEICRMCSFGILTEKWRISHRTLSVFAGLAQNTVELAA